MCRDDPRWLLAHPQLLPRTTQLCSKGAKDSFKKYINSQPPSWRTRLKMVAEWLQTRLKNIQKEGEALNVQEDRNKETILERRRLQHTCK